MRQAIIMLVSLFIKCNLYSQDTFVNNIHIDSNTIVYFLPDEVNKLVKKEMDKNAGKVYFELASLGYDTVKISVYRLNGKGDNHWDRMTNRVVFIDGNPYALVFDFDRMFASSDPGDEIFRKNLKDKNFLYGRKLTIPHDFYYVIFKRSSGVIVTSGYDKF